MNVGPVGEEPGAGGGGSGPASPCQPASTGKSGGVAVSGTAALGLGPVGAAATGSGGFGLFRNNNGTSAGGFLSGGAAAVFLDKSASMPASDSPQQPWVLGAFIGAGGGWFQSNAGTAKQLERTQMTSTLDVAVGGVNVSVGISDGGGVEILTATFGPGVGAAWTVLPTKTVTAGTGCQ